MIKIISLLSLLLTACSSDISLFPKEVTEIEVVLEDTAPQTEVVIEYFVQPSKPESLDVLFLLDTSCSMRDDYEKVSLGMDLLRGDIEVLTHDYQMGIINSSLRGTYFIGTFDSNTSSIEILLAPNVLTADAEETPFASQYEFTTYSPEGLSFLRMGIPKLYVYISDEDEQSSLPVGVFKEWLDEYHGDTQYDVITIAIRENSDVDCSWGDQNIGHRYEQLSNYFNKTNIDFCGDWQLALADSSFLLREITYMSLNRRPIEDSIVVYQDGVKEEYWYYLEATNTVYFEFDILEGSVIKIGYDSVVE